jgi:hypothetical protein
MLGGAELPLSVIYVRDEFEQADAVPQAGSAAASTCTRSRSSRAIALSLPILRAFSEGRIVALQGDRDFNEASLQMTLFGGPAKLPTGPFMLARMTCAKLYPTFIAYSREHHFEVTLEERSRLNGPKTVTPTCAGDGEMGAGARERDPAWPTQWYTFTTSADGSGRSSGGSA